MAQASPGWLVTLHGTPQKCNLKNVKAAIVESLGSKESVNTVKRCKDPKGATISGKLEVALSSEADLQKLLQQAVIDYEDNDNLYSLRLTRSRPRSSVSDASMGKSDPVQSSALQEKHYKHVPKREKVAVTDSSDYDSSTEEDSKPKSTTSGFGKFKTKATIKVSSDDDSTSSSEEDVKSHTRSSTSQQKQNTQRFPKLQKAEKEVTKVSPTKLSKTPIDWFHLLQSDPDIFEKYSDKCVLMHCYLDGMTSKQLLSCLEMKLNVAATQVRNIVRLHDGILTVFCDGKDASKVVKSKNLDIDGNKIQVFSKPVPPVYDDRILVKGNFKGKDKEEIEDMLECCTEAGFKVKKLPQADYFLVAFDESIDVNEIASAMSNLPLEDMHPETVKLCRPDCIKVENVRKGASDDVIKLAFMNRKLNSGDITFVQSVPAGNSAFVYFGSYKDAEKVVEKSKKTEIKVAKKPVEISLYCPGIKGSVDYSSYSISQFRYEIEVDRDVIEFILNSDALKCDLHKELGDLAEVEFVEDLSSDSKFASKLTPLLSEDESQEMEQDNFENECKSRIRKFCSKFKSKSRKYEEESRDRVRKENRWDEVDEGVIEVNEKGSEVMALFVRWEDEKEDGVKATGSPKHVSRFLDWFEEKCNFVREVETFSEKEFPILIDCGIIEETSGYLHENVVINVEKEKRQVFFEGSKEIVAPAVSAVKNNLKRVHDCDLYFLHPIQKLFLQSTLESKGSKDQIDVVDYLRTKLRGAQIKVCLTLDDNALRLAYSSQKRTEAEQAKEKIKELIKFKAISCQSGFDDLMQEDEWKEVKTKVESSGTLLIFRSTKTSDVQLVGLPQSFEQELKRVNTFFEDNVEVEKRVNLPYPETKFICSFPSEIDAKEHLNKTEWYEEPGGIHVKGKACHVRKAESWIGKISRILKTSTQTLSVPGAAEFFRGKGGDQFLQTTSKDTQCVIQLDSVESDEWKEAANETWSESASFKPEERKYVKIWEEGDAVPEKPAGWFRASAKAIGSFLGLSESPPTPKQEASVNVSVKSGDILSSKCDVIVNTTGSDYDLKASILSGKLIAMAGEEMEDECSNSPLHEKKDIYRVTTAPNLPFRNVIHLVTPNTANAISDHLYQALLLVENKLKLSSIAVPAIGTGQIGLSSSDVAKSIRKATDAFKKTDPVNLKRIDVVIFERNMVPDFKKALLGSAAPSKSKKNKQSNSKAQTSHPVITSPVQVKVTRGDILVSTCDVMINTTGSDFNLTASQLSQKLVLKAGSGIGSESPIHQSNVYRVTSGGNTQFHNIVHFVTPSSVQSLSSGLEDVLTFVDRTLNKSSLAIPAVGTGNAKLDITSVANAMNKAIVDFIAKKPKFLQQIEVVIFDQNMLSVFQNNISIKSQPVPTVPHSSAKDDKTNASSTPAIKKSMSEYFSGTNQSESRHSVVLFFTSNDASSMRKAWKAVRDKAEDKCAKQCIDDDILESLDKDGWDEIMAIEREFNVCVRPPDEDDSATNKFFILGLKNKVMEAYAYALKLLQKFHKAVTCQEFISWKYEDQKSQSWENFSLLTNLEIENFYKEHNGSKASRKAQLYEKIKGSKVPMELDFTKMTRIVGNDPTSECKFKRVAITGVSSYPSTWDNTKHVQLVNLDPTKPEYANVRQKFNGSRGSCTFNIRRIERVENRRLYAQFMAQKMEVEERMKASTLPVTMELFHGTHHDTAELIYKGGFNRSYAGRNATYYGNGVYFATTSAYSYNYADPNNQGERKMFLADVVTGEYGQGQQGFIAPPQKPGGTASDLFDSVVDQVAGPSIYVVFKDASVYPLYLLTFT